MSIGEEAEEYIKQYFKEKRYTKLVESKRGGRGFDSIISSWLQWVKL